MLPTHPVLALLLGAIHDAIRLLQDCIHPGRRAGREGEQTQADRYLQAAPGYVCRLGNSGRQALHVGLQHGGVPCQQQHELVAAHPGRAQRRRRQAIQRLRYRLQQGIANRVAVLVVYRLETVQVQIRQPLGGRRRQRQPVGKLLLQRTPVAEAGQRIGQRLAHQLLLHPSLRCRQLP